MIELETILICYADKLNPSILVEGEHIYSLPFKALGEGESSLQVASKLLRDLTMVEAGPGRWVSLIPLPPCDSVNRVNNSGDRLISLCVGCLLPERVQGCTWIPIKDILAHRERFYQDHFEIILSTQNLSW